MTGFFGTYRQKLDSSRITIPAKFKNDIGKKIFLTKETDGSLILRNEVEWTLFTEKLYENFCPTEDEDVFEYIFSNTVDIVIDSHNRILVPPDFLEYAGIKVNVVLRGLGKKVKIWSAEKFDELQQTLNKEDIRKKMIAKGM